MKSRSHRIPIVEPRHDDWVDGSWTVDCICGVNFDDGEEMVNCDECGVWVHTRCSRYVKSEQSFACDKCKSKNVGISIRNENEETEVAEFLVELPTKTLRMDKPNPIFNNPNPAVVSSCRPLRLSIPMEDRVHVQGVPGGDPGLFSGIGMSSIFGPELWKATGYVPKKFNFRYNEFPCWGDDKTGEEEDKKMDKKSDERNVSQADNGAGVLFQLSKDGGNKLPMAVVESVGVKSSDEDGGCHEIVSPRHKKLDGKHLVCSEERLKKKSSSVQSFVLYAGKCKKENLGLSKDQSSTKKVRTIEQELDVNRRTPRSSRSVASTFSSDSKQSEFFQDRGSKATSDVIHSGKDVLGECATNLASNECGPEATTRKNVSSDVISKEGNTEDKVPRRCDNFSKTCGTLTVLDNSRATVAKEKVFRDDLQSCTDAGPVAVNVTLTGSDVKERDTGQDTQIDEADSRPNKKLKAGVDNDDHASLHLQSLPLDDVTLDTTNDTTRHAAYFSAVFSQEDHKASPKSEASQHEVHVGSRNVANCRTDKSDDTPENSSQFKQEPESEGSVGARKRPSGQTDGSEVAGDLVKSDSAVKSHSTALYHRKVVVSVGKSAPNSTNNNVHISSSINRMAAASAKKPSIDSRLKEMSESCVRTMKDSSLIETVKYDEKYVRSKKLLKESSRLNSESKVQAPKLSSTSDLKRMSSGSKDSTIPSSKVSVVSSACTTTQGESSSPPLTEPSNVQNKATVSAVSSKGEQFEQSSSRGNAPSMNAFAKTMSDEELAKLLHQELNSSPRVPRVPRLRNAGNLPQVTVSTGTSMLMKRTSSSGGKDHSMASKWKTKDSSRDGSHGSLEVNDEPKKIDRKHSSSDKRRRDTGVDTISRREVRSGASKDVHSNVQRRPSSKNMSDDDPKNRTLPGLIAEIMSEGKRMTYEELCNAVLPHWPHLRKHNGERYAYSTHSQAVLDCLRNRSEWARLVDRGPKTTSVSRKRRKTDGDSLSFDSEDINDDNTRIDASDIFESHQEELFPKGGKRKSRKGSRRLALQPGRGGTVRTRRRRAVSVTSDDESESFSNSSSENNTMSSEEEENLQGGGAAASRSASEDSSASSDRSST